MGNVCFSQCLSRHMEQESKENYGSPKWARYQRPLQLDEPTESLYKFMDSYGKG